MRRSISYLIIFCLITFVLVSVEFIEVTSINENVNPIQTSESNFFQIIDILNETQIPEWGDYTVTFDRNNKLHVCRGDEKGLIYGIFNGTPVNLTYIEFLGFDSNFRGFCHDIKLDSKNYPHILYGIYEKYDQGINKLKYAYYNGSDWNVMIIDNITTSFLNARNVAKFELDNNDYPHIVFLRQNKTNESNYLIYALFDGSSWKYWEIDVNVFNPNIALDSDQNPHITYIHIIDQKMQELKYTYKNNNSWEYIVISKKITIYDCSFSLDSKNNPHIIYLGYDSSYGKTLYYTYLNQTTWCVMNFGEAYISRAVPSSICLDKSDKPHITYWRLSAYDTDISLIYSYLDGSKWISEIVENISRRSVLKVNQSLELLGFRSLQNPGIILDNENKPLIIYYTLTFYNETFYNIELKCAFRSSVTISLGLTSSSSFLGYKVGITGQLRFREILIRREDLAIPNVPILISYSVTNGESWNDLTQVISGSEGNYSAVWIPAVTGNYLLKATWPGNATFPRIDSVVSLAVTPFDDKDVFTVSSSSRIVSLRFNSTSRILSFQLEGINTTNGYTEVTVSKDLIYDTDDIKVYLDDKEIFHSIKSNDDSYIISFAYRHSTHGVMISLGLVKAEELQSQMYYLFVCGIGIVLFIVLLIFKKR